VQCLLETGSIVHDHCVATIVSSDGDREVVGTGVRAGLEMTVAEMTTLPC